MAISRDVVLKEIKKELARRDLKHFVTYANENYQLTNFHEKYISLINDFAFGKIKRLIISVPPQHGKSEISSRYLPAFLFGINPNNKIGLVSYNATFASKFNRAVQRILSTQKYKEVFPKTLLNEKNVVTTTSYLRNSEEFEIVGHSGSMKVVGVGGGLTGNTIDVLIMDDLYKDYQDATSPTVSDRVWEWYTTVARTRLHNLSQELIVFTRWDENDLVGRLEKEGKVIDYTSDLDLSLIDNYTFVRFNFEAIKESAPTDLDPRNLNEPLWAEKHDLQKLIETRALDPQKFSALYQGQPRTKEGLMYPLGFGTHSDSPIDEMVKCFVDTADTGSDYLCAIFYFIKHSQIKIVDIIYTQKAMDETEPMLVEAIQRNECRYCIIESNNGGRGFARNVRNALSSKHYIEDFTQTKNKESRIFSNSFSVQKTCEFPTDWQIKFNIFATHVLSLKKDAKNKHDDCADALTAIYEHEFDRQNIFVV